MDIAQGTWGDMGRQQCYVPTICFNPKTIILANMDIAQCFRKSPKFWGDMGRHGATAMLFSVNRISPRPPVVCACYFCRPKQWGDTIYYRHSNSQFPPHKIISPAMALPRGGGGREKREKEKGGGKKKKGGKGKKINSVSLYVSQGVFICYMKINNISLKPLLNFLCDICANDIYMVQPLYSTMPCVKYMIF